jgi:hypothetical protein
MRNYIVTGAFILVALIVLGSSGYLYYAYYGKPRCEACGMMITPEIDANYIITDTNTNQRIWVCCAGCMLRLASAHPDMHIEALDSWYATSAPTIVINITGGQVSSVVPSSTRLLLGSKISNSCVSNRIAINETSTQLLLLNGYNPDNPLSPFKTVVPNGTPALNISAALVPLKAKGIQYVPPSAAFLTGIAIAGVAVLAVGVLAWKKLLTPVAAKP